MTAILVPGSKEGSISLSFSFSRWITWRAFSLCRMTTMPPTTSPRPSNSATPRRTWGPISTRATSRNKTGVVRTTGSRPIAALSGRLAFNTICSRSSTFSIYPRPRIICSLPANSIRRPPVSKLERLTASTTAIRGML